jgi:hypothetical protein
MERDHRLCECKGRWAKKLVDQIKEKWRKACSMAKVEAAVNRKSLNQTGGVQL